MSIFDDISLLVQQGKVKDVPIAVQSALDGGASAQQILDEGLLSGMSIVGEQFSNGELFVPEVMVSSSALTSGVELLRPLLIDAGIEPIGRVVICTVQGDLHDIGKNLVKLMMEGVGFECYDLGVDAKPDDIIAKVKETNSQIIALSALLTTTMGGLAVVIEALSAAGLRGKVKVMVGGAAVSEKYANEIGADGYAINAAGAAELAKTFVS